MANISKAKLLYWSKNCIETISAGMERKPNDEIYQAECSGKIHTHELLREHLLRGMFDEEPATG